MMIDREIILAILSAGGLVGFFLIVEVIFRKRQPDPEQSRRLSHLVGTLFGIAIAYFFSKPVFITIALAFLLLIIFSRRQNYFSHIHRVTRKTYGEELLPIGLLLSYIISNANPAVFIPAFLITGVSDPLNGYIVQKYKSHWVGSLVFLASSLLILAFFSDLNLVPVLLIGCIVTLIERVSSYGTDNLTVAVSVAILLSLLL